MLLTAPLLDLTPSLFRYRWAIDDVDVDVNTYQQEAAEMATLDKEMAEEKCIDLETQLTELKDKLEGNYHSARI